MTFYFQPHIVMTIQSWSWAKKSIIKRATMLKIPPNYPNKRNIAVLVQLRYIEHLSLIQSHFWCAPSELERL